MAEDSREEYYTHQEVKKMIDDSREEYYTHQEVKKMIDDSREGYYTHPLTGELLKRTGEYVDIISDVPEELIEAGYIVEDFDDEDLFHMDPCPRCGRY